MASIYKRKNKEGKTCGWRAVIRATGYPIVCKQFERKQEAEDWATSVEQQIRSGQFKFERHKVQRTFSELVDHFMQGGALEHHRSARDTTRHLEYWRGRLGKYALVHLTPEHLGKERQLLVDTPTHRNTKRTSATVNRYIASLSAALTYACRQLRWIDDNPCFNLIKLKEAPGRDRILTEDEVQKLLEACRQSRCQYLYCIVLLAFTTGMRQGEILSLTWNQIDFNNHLAHLKETKNGSPRSVPLVQAALYELNLLFQNRNPSKPLIFASKTPFGKIDINKPWNEALKQAGIEGFVFHSIRHHFATLAARSGASNLQLKTALGHKTLQMLERYTHLEVETTRHLSLTVSQKILGGKNDLLAPAKKVLIEFKSKIAEKSETWKVLGNKTKENEYDSWLHEEAYCWIFADPEYYFLMGNEYKKPIPEIIAAKQKAKLYYDTWLHEDSYFHEVFSYIIQPPNEVDTLESYLEGIYVKIHKQKSAKELELRSLKSFTEHLRSNLPKNQIGFIETLFPEGMKMLNGYIIKNDRESVCPIDILLTAKILQALMKNVIEGRSNTQHCAAEALALCWMCLTSARRRLPANCKMIYKTTLASFSRQQDSDDTYGNNPHGTYALPTLYGKANTFISNFLFEYLSALSTSSEQPSLTILHKPLRSLIRSLDMIVEKIPEARNKGKISFLTFMSLPHETIGERLSYNSYHTDNQ